MQTKKVPEPQEWWVSNDGERIAYICGFDPDGDPVYQINECSKPDIDLMSAFLAEYHHEPLCDSFDWQPASPIDPGEGWELLPVGTVLEDGDEHKHGDGWCPTVFAGAVYLESDGNIYRRRKPMEQWPKWAVGTGNRLYRTDSWEQVFWVTSGGNEFLQADPLYYKSRWSEFKSLTKAEALARVKAVETWPKYYICGTWDHAAYVRKDSDGRITTICRDGSECRWDVETKLTAVLPEGWREVTKAEALARVKPVEPVATDRTPDNRTAREAIKAMLKILNETVGVDADHNAEAFCVGEQWLTDNPEAVERIATPLVTAAIESPDDWVTQDRVPARPGIDDRRYVWNNRTGATSWDDSAVLCWPHGAVHGAQINNSTLELRCRRRDLPPQPRLKRTDTFGRDVTEEYGLHDETDIVTKCIPVRLWVRREMRSDSGRYYVSLKISPPSDGFTYDEIKIGPDGFYVESNTNDG